MLCTQTPPIVKRSPRPRTPQPKTLVYDETRQGFVAPPVKTVDSRDWRCDIIGLKDRNCRFPLWDAPNDAPLYCGKPTACLSEGRPYCSRHAKIAFHPR
jgi:hypothetical protein